MKAVLDTDVIISGLISSAGAPAVIVDLWVNGSIGIAVSPALIQEIIDVIARPKFKPLGTLDERCDLIKKLLERAEIVNPSQILKIISEDDADNRVLECALDYGADYIISGDSHLLDLGDYEGMEILSPTGFLKIWSKKTS